MTRKRDSGKPAPRPLIDEELADQLLGKAHAEGAELLGPDGLLSQVTRAVLERALAEEMTGHLGYEKHDPAGRGSGNSRNGTTPKTVLTDVGAVDLAVPRDRNGSFEPQIVRKGQTRLDGFNERIIALYARGMTTRDIRAHLREMYDVDVSPDLMEIPLAMLGDRAPADPVWHCAVRAAPGDPDLGGGAWMRIAAEIMHRTGLSRRGEEDEAVPWIAVHHGGNHIHIVAMLARHDSRRAHLHNEYYRIGEALRNIEAEYGLVAVARADRTADRAGPRPGRRPGPGRPSRPGSRCAATSRPPRPRPGPSRSSSPPSTRPACCSGSVTIRPGPAARPDTRSACPAWSTRTASRSGTAARPWTST
jgi:hypothetical protein